MQGLKDFIDTVRQTVESSLTTLEEAQNDLVHVKMNQLKDNEKFAEVVSKVQLANEQYSGQVYDGLKVVNALVAQRAKDLVDKIQ